jgi:hypothetical protein
MQVGDRYCSKCGDSLVCWSCNGTGIEKSLFLSLILENIVVAECDMKIIVQAVVVL